MAVPNTFASATSAIPLANLDANFTYYDTAYSITGTTVAFAGNITVTGTTTLTGVATLTANPVLSAGTANGVTYLNGSKSLTSGTGLVFDGTNSRLSINQSSSIFGAQLEVTASTGGQAVGIHGRAADGLSNIVFGANGAGTEYARIQSDNTSSLQFGAGSTGAEKMRIDASGNLGIGVTPSAWGSSKALQIQGTGLSGALYVSNSGITGLTSNYYFNGGDVYAATGFATRYYQFNGQHVWNTAASGTAGNAISFTQAMTLDASGRLLLGTTSASGSNYLQVNSDALVYGLTVGRGAGALSSNTVLGASALAGSVTGGNNVAIGYQALRVNTSGSGGTAVGTNSLLANTTGTDNSAFGIAALSANTTGASNTALGREALQANTTASNNTAVGYQAGYSNTVAQYNTAIGYRALYTQNRTADTNGYNTAIGSNAGFSLTTGNHNNLFGDSAGYTLSTGSGNTFIGDSVGALVTTGSGNTFIGANITATSGSPPSGYYVTTGNYNVILGNYTGQAAPISATGSNYIVLSDGQGNVRQTIDPNGNAQFQAGAVMPFAPAPTGIAAATTLTNNNIQNQIISATGTTYTITMALGTTLETLAPWSTTNIAYDFYVINTATGVITMAVNTGVTSLGLLTIAAATSAHFRIRRTAANTFVLYRLG